MPRRKKRVKIRVSEECFTGHEAVEWLHFYLQTSSNFGSVSREQVNTIVQSSREELNKAIFIRVTVGFLSRRKWRSVLI